MKKSFKRILAFVLVAAFMLAGVQSASAADVATYDGAGSEYIDIEGTFLVDLEGFCPGDIPNVLDNAEYFEFYSYDYDVVDIVDGDLYGVNYGATVIEIEQYDSDYDYVGSIYCLAVVVDEYDRQNDGYIVEAYGCDETINYKQETWLEPYVETEGEDYLYYYTVILNPYSGDASYVEQNGYVYGSGTGTDYYYGVVVDTSGHFEYVDFSVTVRYSFVQWLIRIFLFGWIWY
ncbi:MAG: hypothetical protein ACI4XH_05375 [Acutalibacteraceae bacterium]